LQILTSRKYENDVIIDDDHDDDDMLSLGPRILAAVCKPSMIKDTITMIIIIIIINYL
jgi:hypothetical protein